MFLRIFVPPAVPSVSHGSEPDVKFVARKKQRSPSRAKSLGSESQSSGLMLLNSRVPPIEPSEIQGSRPCSALLALKISSP